MLLVITKDQGRKIGQSSVMFTKAVDVVVGIYESWLCFVPRLGIFQCVGVNKMNLSRFFTKVHI